MTYKVLIDTVALHYVNNLPEKSQRIVKENLKKLGESPYPGTGRGDKEKLVFKGEILYRMHIGRTFTAFYKIYDKENVVKIFKVMTIDSAHKDYGKL
ncbi:MAG: type II toxin-antitoxin system RelE/ParE family toxin [Candidatus Hydrothermarchaeales archaeon]